MKKITLSLLAICAFVLGTFAQSTRSFDLRSFDRLEMGSAFKIDVKPGSFSIKADGDKEDIDDLEARVSSGTLIIRFKDTKNGSWWGKNRRNRVNINITMPALKGIDFSGATSSRIEGFNNIEVFDLELSGASSSTVDVSARRINLDISGASSITLTGKAETMNGDISGATSFKAGDFEVASADLDISGASSARIYVTKSLQADASGASSVRYRGRPGSVNSSTSGASSVKSGE